MASSFLNTADTIGQVTISERIQAGGGSLEGWPGSPVPRSGWSRTDGNGRGAFPARTERISIRTLAAAARLPPSRVHQLVADADLDALDAVLGELREAG
jgi:hypothetical protein